MVFSSFVFLFYFLPFTLAAYYASKKRLWRNIVLLISSLFFYSWGEPFYILLIIASIIVNWLLALIIASSRNGFTFLVAGIAINLSVIGFFKYANFILENVRELIGVNWHMTQVALPIGISFYTFQSISYLIDVHRGTIQPQKNPIFFGTYLAMFPQLIAGPIVRYATIEKEVLEREENLDNFTSGLRRFIIGFCKKVFIANNMGLVADTILGADPSTVGAIPAWFAFIAYTFQIYFDFSGYSDMAIGLGRMFGFHFLENFNYPYISRSVTEFWRRWHISLSSFFRDYLYIPLGGNRVQPFRWIINLIIVWALTGLWHGASWNFVCWGLYYGLIMIGEKQLWSIRLNQLPKSLQHFYTIFIFIIGWVLFRIENFQDIGLWMATLFCFNGLGEFATLNAMNVLHYYPWFFVALLGSTPLFKQLFQFQKRSLIGGYLYDVFLAFLFFTAFTKLATGAFNPFIYFRF